MLGGESYHRDTLMLEKEVEFWILNAPRIIKLFSSFFRHETSWNYENQKQNGWHIKMFQQALKELLRSNVWRSGRQHRTEQN